MKTIETIALGTIFPEQNIDAILEVASATPNPTLALNIILGIYQEPTLKNTSVINNNLCTLVNYDKWEDRVNYKYETNKKVHIYIDKTVDKTLITADNYKDYKIEYWKEGVTVSHWVKLPEIIIEKNYTDSSTWLNGEDKSVTDNVGRISL